MRLAWRSVRLPVVRPLAIGGLPLTERVVMELRIEDDLGRTGVGEASPLPGLHAEKLDDLPDLLPSGVAAVRAAVAGALAFPQVLSLLDEQPRWRSLPPSLRCGLEAAVLSLLAEDDDPAALTGLPVGPAPATSGLFDGGPADVSADLAGLACLKVKVGRRSLADDVATLQALRAVLGDGAELRLDANRAFSLVEAVAFARAIADTAPVWIEEPLRDPATFPEFVARTGLPVALDESLHDPAHAHLSGARGVAAWVLKPALLGVQGTLVMFARAAAMLAPPRCVVSSSFEGPCGLALLAALARCAPGRPAPGLGTAAWLGEPAPGPWTVVDG